MADGSTKPISEVKLGDKVKATDPTTGHTTDRDVVATIVHTDEDDMTRLTVTNDDGTTGTIDATSWHPVWVAAEGRFVNISDLKPGQRLTSVDGTSPEVTGLDRYTDVEPVYDVTIEGVHTYYVHAETVPVLVHNCGSGDPLDEAREARDALAAEWGPDKATVTAGRDPVSGRIAAGCNSNPTGCAEADVVRQLGIDPKDVMFTEAIRPRTGRQVPICHKCQETFGPTQFPSGTLVKPGGAWNMEVVS